MCDAEEPQKEVTREVIEERTVVQRLVEPKKGEVKKEEPKEAGKVEEPVQKYEDLPPKVTEKLPEEAR